MEIQVNKDMCFLCGCRSTDTHHIFNGNGLRKKSDEDGLVVYLCRNCHNRVHTDYAIRHALKQLGQGWYENNLGSREEFIKRYRKNYL